MLSRHTHKENPTRKDENGGFKDCQVDSQGYFAARKQKKRENAEPRE